MDHKKLSKKSSEILIEMVTKFGQPAHCSTQRTTDKEFQTFITELQDVLRNPPPYDEETYYRSLMYVNKHLRTPRDPDPVPQKDFI